MIVRFPVFNAMKLAVAILVLSLAHPCLAAEISEASLRAADGNAKWRLGLGLTAVGIVIVALYWACFA